MNKIASFTQKHFRYIVLIVLPICLAIYVTYAYHAKVPILDEWDFSKKIDLFYSGELQLNHLWEPIAGHRIVFPQIWMLTWAALTHWNISVTLFFNFVLNLTLFSFILFLLSQIKTKKDNPVPLWSIPLISMFYFSLIHMRNWLWSWQATVWIWILVSVIGLMCLDLCKKRKQFFLGAIGCAVISSFSFLGGLNTWVAGLLIIFFSKEYSDQKKLLRFWLAAGILTSVCVFSGYEIGSTAGKGNIVYNIIFFLKLLGAPFFRFFTINSILNDFLPHCLALVVGLCGVVYFIRICVLLIRERGPFLGKAFFFMGLGLIMLLTAGMISMSRIHLTVLQPFASRYMIYAALFWISFLVLLFIYSHKKTSVVTKSLLSIFCIFIFLTQALSIPVMLKGAKYYKEVYNISGTELEKFSNEKKISSLHPNRNFLMAQIDVLKKHQLSVFKTSS